MVKGYIFWSVGVLGVLVPAKNMSFFAHVAITQAGL